MNKKRTTKLLCLHRLTAKMSVNMGNREKRKCIVLLSFSLVPRLKTQGF